MDTKQLQEHLKGTPHYIALLRQHMTPGNLGYTDAPAPSGFGPKSPCNEHAMHLADLEAAFIGNLARYCIAMGTIPPHTLKGLWFINGECKGLHTYGLRELPALINHLTHWAPYIIGTEGIDDLLKAGEETRWHTKHTLPSEQQDEWITQKQAEELTGRAYKTLWTWRKEDIVRHHKNKHGIVYNKQDLELMKKIREENQKVGRKGLKRNTKNPML